MGFVPVWQPVVGARFSMLGVRKAAPGSAPESRRGSDVTGGAFGRGRRLTEATEFTRVFARARRSSDRYFTVLCRTSTTNRARLGLTISRRAAKRAVDRNRLKRLARESFRRLQLRALDFGVMAREQAVMTDSATLQESLDRHFRRLSAGDDRPTRA